MSVKEIMESIKNTPAEHRYAFCIGLIKGSCETTLYNGGGFTNHFSFTCQVIDCLEKITNEERGTQDPTLLSIVDGKQS